MSQVKLAGFNLKKLGGKVLQKPPRAVGTGGRGYKIEEGEFLKIRHPKSNSYVRFSSELANKMKLTYESSVNFIPINDNNGLLVLVRPDQKLPFGVTYNSKPKKSEQGKGYKVISAALSELPMAQFKLKEDSKPVETTLEEKDENEEVIELPVTVFEMVFEKELKLVPKGRGRKKKKEKEEGSDSESSENSDSEEEDWDEEDSDDSEDDEDSEEEWDEEE